MEKRVEELIIKNTNLIYLALKKLGMYNKLYIENYYDVGMIGLVKGAINYKQDLGFKETTYLMKCIINEILNQRRREKTKVNYDTVLSLEEIVFDKLTLEDFISNDVDIEREMILKNDIEKLYLSIMELTEREKYVIIHSYGLFGAEKIRQDKMACELKITQASISRMKLKIIRKLRGKLNETEKGKVY